MKRIVLFLLTNLAVMLVLSVTANIIANALGINLSGSMGGLLFFCAIMGFGGAFISLAMSKWSAKRMTGAVVIDSPSSSYLPMPVTLISCVWPPETSSATNGNSGGFSSSIGARRCPSIW